MPNEPLWIPETPLCPDCQDSSCGEYACAQDTHQRCPVADDFRACMHPIETDGICPDCLAGGYLSRLYEIPSDEGIFFCRECDFTAKGYSLEKNSKRVLALVPDVIAILDNVIADRDCLMEDLKALEAELAVKKSEIAGLECALNYRKTA